ncbi:MULTISPECIES: hypothetical protein [Pseudomonadota]|uniref:Uncharacterized protein n=1 Tax=Mycoplana rhizolycopersici TaxID=2746702 RepID=A0ABX2QJ35_9HYPH|nr:hypothetical protein [Rhizobium rhizolycopersici]NVP57805.1 hypothetical protein [Rhizobium rhizolycopersici]
MNRPRLYIFGAAAAVLIGLWVLGHPGTPMFYPAFAGSPYMDPHMAEFGFDYGCGYGHRFCRWVEGIERGVGALTGNPYQPPFADPTQLGELKSTLGITQAQEADWDTYEAALQGGVMAVERDQDSLPVFSWFRPHGAHFVDAMIMNEEAQKQSAAITVAAQSLLSKLTPEQQAKARYMLPGLPAGPNPFIGIE